MTLRREADMASPYPTAGAGVKAALGSMLLLLAACGGGVEEETADTPSGYPVPRWISVRGAPASMRAGPGLDYPVLWQFERSGAPLQVVTETEEWRKVCGPDGSIAWIHRSLTSGRLRALTTEATAMRASPDPGADVRAQVADGALLGVEACADGWCEVSADDLTGWVPETVLFGTARQPICDARAPATPGTLAIDGG
jgi:SH3-like domain-containing protein